MSDFKRIPVLIDAATGKQIDEFGAVTRDNAFFRLLFDETVILCCQFYDLEWSDGEVQLSAHPIDPDLLLSAFGNNVFDPAVSLMFLSTQSTGPENKVNIVGDWFEGTTATPADGQISFRIDTNTTRFAEVLANSNGTEKFYFCITGILNGQSEKTVLAYFRFKAENRPTATSGAPASADPEYFTALEVQALINNKLDKDFSLSDTKINLVDEDTTVFNDSENSGNMIVITCLKIWNYIKSKADAVYAAISHSHAVSDVTALQTSLDAKQDALGFSPEDSANKGVANGYAELDAAGKVPAAQLPSFVDDVLEYVDFASLPGTGETEKIYVTLDNNKTYRWSGSAYVEISASLALGETDSTAYRGDRGKTAYDHSQASGNQHSMVKGDIGLGNVDNTSDADKPVSTAQQTALDNKTLILASISGESFIYPKPGIVNPFSNAANSANIEFDVDNYADAVALLSTSSNEPRQLPAFKIPAGTTSLKFRSVYLPETGNSWSSENVVWKGEFKKMTDNSAWSSVTAFSIGTDTVPASGSAPQLYEETVPLATLGLAVGDTVQMVVFVDSTSSWAHDIGGGLFEIEVVA